MKEIKDNFSQQAEGYKKYRPTYPPELYAYVLRHTAGRAQCWDCGTGNGQVATALSPHFKQVFATDISPQQIEQAAQGANITYLISRAEQTPFADQQFDLITVAQAIHWFDFVAFNREARRVLKDTGTIAVWGYGLLKIDEEVDPVIQHFYQEVIGPYWDSERKHIDKAYRSIPFDFQEIPVTEAFAIPDRWDLAQLEGYLNTWSSVQNYLKTYERNPVDEVINRLKPIWKAGDTKPVRFPVFLKMGKNKKEERVNI